MTSKNLPEPIDVLFRVKRGLAGYVSYLAACEMNASFSEYVLYEPILRILTARGYAVECEAACPGMPRNRTGDHKRIDFVATGPRARFALEVKWAKSRRPRLQGDQEKLLAFKSACAAGTDRAFLCVFGKKSDIEALELPQGFKEQGRPVVAEFDKTRFGCRMFELMGNTTKQG